MRAPANHSAMSRLPGGAACDTTRAARWRNGDAGAGNRLVSWFKSRLGLHHYKSSLKSKDILVEWDTWKAKWDTSGSRFELVHGCVCKLGFPGVPGVALYFSQCLVAGDGHNFVRGCTPFS